MPNEESAKPAPLPGAAPKALKDFVACKELKLELDSTKLDWVPNGPLGDFAPTPTIEPGDSPNEATIRYGILELPASIGADGQLEVDTSGVPAAGPLTFLRDGIDDWVKAFNKTMKANKRRLEGISFKGTKVSVTKVPITAAPEATAVAVPAAPAKLATTEPTPESETEDKSSNGGCLASFMGLLASLGTAWIMAALAVVAISTVGIGFLATRDGDDSTTATEVPTEEEPQTDAAESDGDEDAEIDTTDDEGPVEQDIPEETDEVSLRFDFPAIEIDDYKAELPTEVQVWNVAQATILGSTEAGGPTMVTIVLRDTVGDGTAFLAHVRGGVFDLGSPAALELYTQGPPGQQGSTSFVYPPGKGAGEGPFPTFGVGQGQDGIPCPGGDGYLVFGSIPGDDPRTAQVFGATGYVPLGPGEGFPIDSTGTTGTSFSGPGAPGSFVYDPDTDTYNFTPPIEEGFQGCLDEADPDLLAGWDFFSGASVPVPDNGGGAALPFAAFPHLDPFVMEDTTGGGFVFTPSPVGDTFDCGTETPVDNLGADITGVVGSVDGNTADLWVTTNQSPQVSMQDFSSAVSLQTVTVGNNQSGNYLLEIHAGEKSIGAVADGNVDPSGADVTIDGDSVRFRFAIDPADPVAAVIAQGFNTAVDGDPVACDFVFAPVLNSPLPATQTPGSCVADPSTACLNNGRFEVQIIGSGGPMTRIDTDIHFTGVFESGDTTAWVSVYNGCEINNGFWVSAAAATDDEIEVEVTDTATGEFFIHPLGGSTPAITDTSAFDTCVTVAPPPAPIPEPTEALPVDDDDDSIVIPDDLDLADEAGDDSLADDGSSALDAPVDPPVGTGTPGDPLWPFAVGASGLTLLGVGETVRRRAKPRTDPNEDGLREPPRGDGGPPRTVTAEQRAAEREIHAGAQDAGVKIAGLTEVSQYEDSFAGSKDNPVEIGQKMTVRVRVAEDGTLLPRRENSDASTPPATSILTIEVIPSVEFDSGGDAHVVWNGYASQVDVATSRVIATSLSGPTTAEQEALQGDRPALEYGNDPAYKDGMLEHMAGSRAEAVTQALAPLVSGGKMNVGRQ